MNRVHFIGIGGVGVAGLAHLAADLGMRVSGSDLTESAMLPSLRARGIPIAIGHGQIPAGTELVVHSTAVPEQDVERQEARCLGIPQMRRGEFLNRVIAPHFPIRVAVAGSHGKSTTSAMLRQFFLRFSPGYFVGARLLDSDRNAAVGAGRILISEVDESDSSQDGFPATLAVVLNVEDDHAWSVGGEDALHESFRRLAEGAEVVAWRTPVTQELFPQATFVDVPLECGLTGLHNRQNAAVALTAAQLAVAQGMPAISREECIAALESFPGIARRMSICRETPNLVVLEDYAHHPTELAALLEALREKYPRHRMHLVFQPHRLERVTRYGEQFAKLLSRCDWCGVLPPFGAWRTDGASVDVNHLLTDKITVPHQALTGEFGAMASAIVSSLSADAPTVLAIVGAGDVTKLTPLCLSLLP